MFGLRPQLGAAARREQDGVGGAVGLEAQRNGAVKLAQHHGLADRVVERAVDQRTGGHGGNEQALAVALGLGGLAGRGGLGLGVGGGAGVRLGLGLRGGLSGGLGLGVSLGLGLSSSLSSLLLKMRKKK